MVFCQVTNVLTMWASLTGSSPPFSRSVVCDKGWQLEIWLMDHVMLWSPYYYTVRHSLIICLVPPTDFPDIPIGRRKRRTSTIKNNRACK